MFKKRIPKKADVPLSERQKNLLHYIVTNDQSVSKEECSRFLGVSGDTVLRDLKVLLSFSLIVQVGKGRGTRYIKESVK